MTRKVLVLDEASGRQALAELIVTDLPASVAQLTPHPDLAAHDAIGLATDTELTAHAQTAHGLASHAIDGAFHSGAGVLPSAGQKNALTGTAGTPGAGNEYVTTQDARNTNARTPTAHSHPESDVTGLTTNLAEKAAAGHNHDAAYAHAHPYAAAAHAHLDADLPAGLARDAEVAAAYSPVGHTHAAPAPVYAVLANGATDMAFGPNDVVKVTPTANATYTTAVPAAGRMRTLFILTSGTTSRTITFGAGFKPAGTLATGTVSARVFVLEFVSDGVSLYEMSRTAALVA